MLECWLQCRWIFLSVHKCKSRTQCTTSLDVSCKVLTFCILCAGEKPFECKLCHQRSRDYSAMIKHLRTHNGASPYQCTICLEYCPSLSAMQKHMKGHKPEDIPPDWRIEKTYLYLCYVWRGGGGDGGEGRGVGGRGVKAPGNTVRKWTDLSDGRGRVRTGARKTEILPISIAKKKKKHQVVAVCPFTARII